MTFNKSLYLVKQIFCFIIFLQIMEKDILNYLPTIMFHGTPDSLISTAHAAHGHFTKQHFIQQFLVSRIPTNTLVHLTSAAAEEQKTTKFFYFMRHYVCLSFKQMSHGVIKQV